MSLCGCMYARQIWQFCRQLTIVTRVCINLLFCVYNISGFTETVGVQPRQTFDTFWTTVEGKGRITYNLHAKG
jgi:hypothetical protein